MKKILVIVLVAAAKNYIVITKTLQKGMKQFFSYYAKGMAIFTASFFLLLFAATKTNAQWMEVGGTNGSYFEMYINSITTDGGGNVYAAGEFPGANALPYVAKWDGTAWSELGGTNGSFDRYINSITTDVSGNVYAGGNFDYVAKWNGTVWSELGGTNGSPFNNDIQSIATDASGNVYAGGFFTDANGNYYVAKWNGTAWSELGGTNGTPFSNYIWSITTDASGNVYGGGHTPDANGNYYVAKWNDTAWTELGDTNGSTFNADIYSIATDTSGNVYAAGRFTDANGYTYIAKCNGTAWSELGRTNGSTFNAAIQSITTDADGNVYAAGDFTDANGKYYVAKWNGTAWSELGGANGSTFNGYILSLTTNPSGNVYAAGEFLDANNFYVAEYTLTLPVTLVSITATKENKDVAVNWQTANEINTSHFNVERSTDGSSFTEIGIVKAAGSGGNSYQFMDNKPAKGMIYYRLQNVDKDGSFTYSAIRTINEAVSFGVSIYPNPVVNNLNLSFNSDKEMTVVVSVVDNGGKVVAEQQVTVAAGASTHGINVGGLSSGEYYVRVVTVDGENELKFMKE